MAASRLTATSTDPYLPFEHSTTRHAPNPGSTCTRRFDNAIGLRLGEHLITYSAKPYSSPPQPSRCFGALQLVTTAGKGLAAPAWRPNRAGGLCYTACGDEAVHDGDSQERQAAPAGDGPPAGLSQAEWEGYLRGWQRRIAEEEATLQRRLVFARSSLPALVQALRRHGATEVYLFGSLGVPGGGDWHRELLRHRVLHAYGSPLVWDKMAHLVEEAPLRVSEAAGRSGPLLGIRASIGTRRRLGIQEARAGPGDCSRRQRAARVRGGG